MRALVTGGAGFIGSALVDRLLAEEYTVDVVDDLSRGSLAHLSGARRDHPRQLSFHHLDICSGGVVELMRRRRPEVVFHLAGRTSVAASVADPLGDAEVNLSGALRVIEGARLCEAAKLVFASSAGAIYGPLEASDLPVRESHPQRPDTPHGAAKKAVADFLFAYRERYSLEFTALAIASVYGPARSGPGPRPGGRPAAAPARPGEEGDSVVATFAQRLIAGEACTLEGGGRQTRDFVYLDDVVDALARAAVRGSGLLLNVATGIETSIARLYELVAAAVGVDRAAVPGPGRPGEPLRACFDPSRAEIHLGWRPWTTLAAGVAAVVGGLGGATA